MGQVAIYSRVERRHRWSDEERWQILEEVFSPDAKVLHVARQHDISTGLIVIDQNPRHHSTVNHDASNGRSKRRRAARARR